MSSERTSSILPYSDIGNYVYPYMRELTIITENKYLKLCVTFLMKTKHGDSVLSNRRRENIQGKSAELG